MLISVDSIIDTKTRKPPGSHQALFPRHRLVKGRPAENSEWSLINQDLGKYTKIPNDMFGWILRFFCHLRSDLCSDKIWQKAMSEIRIKIGSGDKGLSKYLPLVLICMCSENCGIVGWRRTWNISRGPWTLHSSVEKHIWFWCHYSLQ